jgi:hypothetical protein
VKVATIMSRLLRKSAVAAEPAADAMPRTGSLPSEADEHPPTPVPEPGPPTPEPAPPAPDPEPPTPEPGPPPPQLRAAPEPEPEAEPLREDVPEAVAYLPRNGDPREWNVWELERLAREREGPDPVRDEELAFLLLELRQFANADGRLPVGFDPVVRESFGELLYALV